MPLDEYRRKRDFSKTPEPSGEGPTTRGGKKKPTRYFCVQKHLVRRRNLIRRHSPGSDKARLFCPILFV
tara:strand:+ start:69 stop:275 length:207 start_codon:yes stop_codon:yes gene_type:complete